MLIEVQKLIDGKPIPKGRVFIGPYGQDPYSVQSDSVYTDSAYAKPINAIGGIPLDYDGFPVDDNGQRVNLYTPDGYSIQLFTQYGNPVFPEWRDVDGGGGGLSADVAENINQLWTFSGGATIGGDKYGQTADFGYGPIPVKFLRSFDNSASGGTVTLNHFCTTNPSTSSTSLVVSDEKFTNTQDWAVGDSATLYTNNIYDPSTGVRSGQNANVKKTATGFNTVNDYVAYDGSAAAGLSLNVIDGIPKAAAKGEGDSLPVDGRILTEEVTASRALTKADIGKLLIVTGAADVTLTVPVNLQDKTFNCIVQNETTSNVVTITGDGTSTITNKDLQYNIVLGGTASILPTLTTDTYKLYGETA